MRSSALVLAMVGCAYRPDSFHHAEPPYVRARVSVACLDVAIERRPDLDDGSTVLGYAFGNRCGRPALVDLANIQLVGRTRTGVHLTLTAYDPERELRPKWLDAHSIGREAISYVASTEVTTLCLDVATIARASSSSWICVER